MKLVTAVLHHSIAVRESHAYSNAFDNGSQFRQGGLSAWGTRRNVQHFQGRRISPSRIQGEREL